MSNITSPVEAPGKRKEMLTGKALTTTSGTLSTVAGDNQAGGFTIAKTAAKTGRYTLTLGKAYNHISFAAGSVEISADTAAVIGKAVAGVLRGVSASGKVAYIQFTTTPTAGGAGADAEVEDGATIRVLLVCNRGNL